MLNHPTQSADRRHTGGVSYGGLTTPPETEEARQRRAAAMVALGLEYAKTPQARFVRRVTEILASATADCDTDVQVACLHAWDCGQRGLGDPMDRETAGKLLDEIEAYADVRLAREALAELVALSMAAE